MVEDDDPLYWDEEPDEAPAPPLTLGVQQKTLPGQTRTKTLAEALIDAVQGVVDTPKVHTCSCGSTQWRTLSGLDGHTQKQCKKCRIRVPWCTTSKPVRAVASRAGPFAGGAAPTYYPPFTPTFKR